MQIEYNVSSIMAYYGVSSKSALCKNFIFDIDEPISTEILPQNMPVYCLFSTEVSAFQRQLPFPDVMRRTYGWPDTVCVCESFSHSTLQRTGLFLVSRDAIEIPFQMYPQYAYSIAFFTCMQKPESIEETFGKEMNSLLSSPPALCNAAFKTCATLFHCINGCDGYSVNQITGRDSSL